MPLVAYTIEQPADVTERKHREFLNKSNRTTLERHRNVRMGKHFKNVPETAPGGPYGYAKRSPGYLKRKQRLVGHTRPNDFTGQTKRITRRSKVRATYKSATLKIRPNFQSRGNKQAFAKFVANKRKQRKGQFLSTRRAAQASRQLAQRIRELEAITDAERREIGQDYQETYNQQLIAFRRTRKRIHLR